MLNIIFHVISHHIWYNVLIIYWMSIKLIAWCANMTHITMISDRYHNYWCYCCHLLHHDHYCFSKNLSCCKQTNKSSNKLKLKVVINILIIGICIICIIIVTILLILWWIIFNCDYVNLYLSYLNLESILSL